MASSCYTSRHFQHLTCEECGAPLQSEAHVKIVTRDHLRGFRYLCAACCPECRQEQPQDREQQEHQLEAVGTAAA